MKRLLIITVCAICCTALCYGKSKQPDWITKHPQSKNAYIGIASAPLSDSNYRDMARKSALNNMAAEINVNIESSSFMRMVDIDGKTRELFDMKINETLTAELSGQELVDSYETNSHYYVYYKLDKDTYDEFISNKRATAIKNGLDYLSKGKSEEQSGNLMAALSIYAKGMAEIESCLNLELSGSYDGRHVNVATELYVAYKDIFSGMLLTSNVKQIAAEALKSIREPIAVCLSKRGVVIPNMLITAKFSSGDGAITPSTKSDYTGTAIFYLTNITSKSDIQSIDITLDKSILNDLPEAYKSLISTSDWPMLKVMVAVTDPVHTASFDIASNDVPECEGMIRSIFANNYFEVTKDSDAELYILYSTSLRVGNEVDGQMYKMKECFCTLSVKIYNNRSQSLLGEYATPDIRVLVPASKSAEQTSQMCAREMMKRFKVGLPKVLKNMKI